MNKYVMLLLVTIIYLALSAAFSAAEPAAESDFSPGLAALFTPLSDDETAPVWVFFIDRGLAGEELLAALEQARSDLPERTLRRRIKGGVLNLDEKDLPVCPAYIEVVRSAGAGIRIVTRYFNGVSADMTLSQAEAIAALPFVRAIRPVARGFRRRDVVESYVPEVSGEMDYNYGESYAQLEQINVIEMHDRGFTGEGVLVCLLDTGYYLEHEAFLLMDIVATYDFINGDSVVINQPGDPANQHNHGTYTLSACGAFVEGSLVGPAFGASFMAGKTEMVDEEIPIEEDYYVAGLEWADSLGADVVSTSLGYLDWYTFEDMDGNTAVTTIGVDIAVSHGIVCCTAAGNERGSSWGHIIAPADADSVVAVGAVSSSGVIASFSSPGPTYDGRIKPEVCAQGVATRCASPYGTNLFTYASGTSLSTPLIGGAAALIIQAHPNWPPMSVREAMMMTASNSATPDNDYGWGIVDALAAAEYSYPPVIEQHSPDEDTVIVYIDSTVTLWVSATDQDEDPLNYVFMVDDSVWAQNDSGLFEVAILQLDTVIAMAIAEDLMLFADTVSWIVITEEYNALALFDNHFGEGWHLLSIPLQPEYSPIDSVFGDDINGIYFVFDYAPTSGYFLIDSVEHGEGYWLALEDTVTIDIEGYESSDSTAIDLYQGWNMVGAAQLSYYPLDSLNFTDEDMILTFTQAVDSGWISAAFYGFDHGTGSYALIDALEPWGGYWLNALLANLQMITYPLSSDGGELMAVKDEFRGVSDSEEFDHWAITIVVSEGGIINDITSFGMNGGATDGYDSRFDFPLPPIPPNGNYVRAVFEHPEWNSPAGDLFATDVRSLPEYDGQYVWTFRIEASDPGPVAVDFSDISEHLPAGYTATAMHGGQSTNLRKISSFTFDYTSPYEVIVIVSGAGIAVDDIEGALSFSGEYSLAGIYPNPFNSAALVGFSVPRLANVRIAVYDILGREAAELANRVFSPGYYSLKWDASGVSSGVYFISMVSGDYRQMRKALLVR